MEKYFISFKGIDYPIVSIFTPDEKHFYIIGTEELDEALWNSRDDGGEDIDETISYYLDKETVAFGTEDEILKALKELDEEAFDYPTTYCFTYGRIFNYNIEATSEDEAIGKFLEALKNGEVTREENLKYERVLRTAVEDN